MLTDIIYLLEGLFEVVLRVVPASDSVTEKDKVLHDSARIHLNHLTHASER